MKEGFDVGLEMSGSQPGFNNMVDNMKNGGKDRSSGPAESRCPYQLGKGYFQRPDHPRYLRT